VNGDIEALLRAARNYNEAQVKQLMIRLKHLEYENADLKRQLATATGDEAELSIYELRLKMPGAWGLNDGH